ncbi:MAG: hypothetical protein M1381_04180 [Deltaproteobacteria bacterium]|nr:hypothetical protein [Deltaproteobacteria bacterium]MCL5792804.1 hypothetical protein [Deltaproteobacteria bacterium]
MKYKVCLLLFVPVLILTSIAVSYGFGYAPPDQTWKTIQSKHFSIIFTPSELDIAQKLMNIAESYYRKMTSRMNWVPQRKTYILLTNSTDSTNGETTPYYYDHIIIYAVPPDAYTSIINYDYWLKMIFVHEYTHILHLDQSRGFFGFLNDIFGRVLFTNFLEPDWIIEGYAVYNESTLTQAGRDNGSYYNTILRMQALTNTLPPIDRGDGIPSKWPYGEYPYLYGGKFLQYIGERYGAAALAEYSKEYTYLPFFIETSSKHAFKDESFITLWREWQVHLRKQAMLEYISFLFSGPTPSKQLTFIGADTRSPVWDNKGKGIFYTSYNGMTNMAIFYKSLKTGKTKRVTLRNSNHTNSACNQRLFFSQEDYFKNFYLYSDLYELNLKTNRTKQLTHGLRVRGPDVSYNCSKVVFVSNTSTVSSLMIYRLTDPGSVKTIAMIKGSAQFLDPRWSYDGNDIAVTVKYNDGETDIKILNKQGEFLTTVVADTHLNLFPAWSRDNRFVMFSSDRTGIANLYAYSITDKTIYMITNVIGGAYESQVSPDDKMLAFVQYDKTGFNVYEMPFSPSTFRTLNRQREFLVRQVKSCKHTKAAITKYSPWDTLRPTWWLPAVTLDPDAYSVGVYTQGSDLLGYHNYYLLADYTGYQNGKSSPGFFASYTNDAYPPQIGINGGIIPYIAETYTEPASNTTHSYVLQKSNAELDISYPINNFRYRQSIGIGYDYALISSLTHLPAYVSNAPFTGKLSGFTATYAIDTTYVFDTSISRENGVYFNTSLERDLSALGSDLELTQFYSQLRAYLPGLGANHVIYFRGIYDFVAGPSKGSQLLSIGGLPSLLANQNLSAVPIRGYPAGILTGDKALSLTIEYRYPVAIIDRGINTLPVYFDKVSLAPYADIGTNTIKTITSYGMELHIDTYIAYLYNVRFSFGYAYALNAFPSSSFYFFIGAPIQ